MKKYALVSKYLWKSVPQWICLSVTEKVRGIIKSFASNSVDETAFENRESRTTQSIVMLISFLEPGAVFHANIVAQIML